MTINLVKSRSVFFPEIPAELGKSTQLYLHFNDLQDELSKQVTGLFDNDAVLRDALNTAVTVAVTAPGDIVYATGTGWGTLPIATTASLMVTTGSFPAWATPASVNIPTVSGATTGAVIYYNGTTGWSPTTGASSGQVLSLSGTAPAFVTKAGPVDVTHADTAGKMIISSNNSWVPLEPGTTGQVLTMTNSIPSWSTAVVSPWTVVANSATTIVNDTSNILVLDTLSATKSYRYVVAMNMLSAGDAISSTVLLRFSTGGLRHQWEAVSYVGGGAWTGTGNSNGLAIRLSPPMSSGGARECMCFGSFRFMGASSQLALVGQVVYDTIPVTLLSALHNTSAVGVYFALSTASCTIRIAYTIEAMDVSN